MPIICILVFIREEFWQRVQTLLSQKRKTFSQTFLAFLQSIQNFDDFGKRHQLHSLNILELIASEKCGYLIPRKLLF